ncbi:MAG: hypothetical protein RIT27_640 [Pseudomonadota bacterium]|jgi:uncharacterized Zn-finger protein
MHTLTDMKGNSTPNQRSRYEINQTDLPLVCPTAGSSLWNSHPRVFLPIKETGRAKCPYCGTEYVLIDP